jgi:uncharacterized damage-inducible protein DinB
VGDRATADVYSADTGRTLPQAVRALFPIDTWNLESSAADGQRDLVPKIHGGRSASLPLDTELESDRTALASRLITATERWSGYVASLDGPALAGDLRYTMTTGQARVLPMSGALLHVFNHATHHRGQITAAISMLRSAYQPLDLPLLIFSELA